MLKKKSPLIALAIGASVTILITSCNAKTSQVDHQGFGSASPTQGTANEPLVREVSLGLGLACDTNGVRGPASYNVTDIGKPGVPKVSLLNVRMIKSIRQYVHPSTLRFAYVSGIVPFVVYDASNGVCSGGQYMVLNAKLCNLFYVPTDVRFGVTAAPGCLAAPRPWIPNDHGSNTAPTWQNYPNNH